MKILVDHSVRQDAIVGDHGFRFEEVELFGEKVRYLQPATRIRPRRTGWRQKEFENLPKVAELIRQGRVQAFTTHELCVEASRALKFSSSRQLDVFEGCTFEILPAPIDRSKWGLSTDHLLSKEDVIAYCESFFLSPSPTRTERFITGMRENPRFDLSSFEEHCLRRAHVFQAICRGIHRSHYPDALHLWTAEENGMDAFLTHDLRFRNVISRQNVNLHCRLVLPSELLETAQRVK